MQVVRKVSLCPECAACPEIEVLQDEQGTTVRIGEGDQKISLSSGAWNTLIRYVRAGVLEDV